MHSCKIVIVQGNTFIIMHIIMKSTLVNVPRKLMNVSKLVLNQDTCTRVRTKRGVSRSTRGQHDVYESRVLR